MRFGVVSYPEKNFLGEVEGSPFCKVYSHHILSFFDRMRTYLCLDIDTRCSTMYSFFTD